MSPYAHVVFYKAYLDQGLLSCSDNTEFRYFCLIFVTHLETDFGHVFNWISFQKYKNIKVKFWSAKRNSDLPNKIVNPHLDTQSNFSFGPITAKNTYFSLASYTRVENKLISFCCFVLIAKKYLSR
jgi:hypothetical protein